MNESRAVIGIRSDGAYKIMSCPDGYAFQLEDLQRMVDGNIEVVPTVLGTGWSQEDDVKVLMLANEEGKNRGLPVNLLATDLSAIWDDEVVGNVVILGARGDEMIGLTREAAENIVKKWLGE